MADSDQSTLKEENMMKSTYGDLVLLFKLVIIVRSSHLTDREIEGEIIIMQPNNEA